jgi:hypothetical protein
MNTCNGSQCERTVCLRSSLTTSRVFRYEIHHEYPFTTIFQDQNIIAMWRKQHERFYFEVAAFSVWLLIISILTGISSCNNINIAFSKTEIDLGYIWNTSKDILREIRAAQRMPGLHFKVFWGVH